MTVMGQTLGRMTGWTALWRNRRTMMTLIQRDLAVKYQRSVLGYLWSLIEPLGLAAIYYFVFGYLYKSNGTHGIEGSYPVYVVSGIFAWQWANAAMSESTRALTSQGSLITTMRVPREIFPVAKVVARFAEFAAGIPIIVVFALFEGGEFSWSLIYLPLVILIQTALLVGLAFILSAANVLMRDIERFMRLATRMLFYAAPVVYPLAKMTKSGLPDWVKYLYQANPYVGIMEMQHAAWNPNILVPWQLLVYTAGASLLVLFIGWAIFRKLERSVLKEL